MKLTQWIITLTVIAVALTIFILIGHCVASQLGQERLSAWGGYLTGVGTVTLAFAAFLTGMQAIAEYKNRNKSEQARWVMQLFAQFFQDHRYQFIRQKIDFDDMEDIFPLMARDLKRDTIFAQEERDLLDRFTDYLNFFEMMAYLAQRKQIAADDIKQMFDYYLRRLTDIHRAKDLSDYLEKAGFENLCALLVKYKGAAKKSTTK
jgi:hypothetical protein